MRLSSRKISDCCKSHLNYISSDYDRVLTGIATSVALDFFKKKHGMQSVEKNEGISYFLLAVHALFFNRHKLIMAFELFVIGCKLF